MMEALELRMLDESLHEHRQAFLNFAVKAEKKVRQNQFIGDFSNSLILTRN